MIARIEVSAQYGMTMKMNIQDQFLPWWEEHEQNYDLLLLDVDGTLVQKHTALPGVDEMLKGLEKRGFPWYVLTNDGHRSHAEKSASISKSGLNVPPSHLVSCADALLDFVRNEELEGQMFFRAGYFGSPDYGESAGLKMTDDTARIPECRGFILPESLDRSTMPDILFNAFLDNPDRYLIVPNPDSYWPGSHPGEFVLGSAPFARMLQKVLAEKGVRVSPHFLGKPHHGIFDHAIKVAEEHYDMSLGDRHRILMLGDSVHSDIPGAVRGGMDNALVLTGITHEDQLRELKGDNRPRRVFRRIA